MLHVVWLQDLKRNGMRLGPCLLRQRGRCLCRQLRFRPMLVLSMLMGKEVWPLNHPSAWIFMNFFVLIWVDFSFCQLMRMRNWVLMGRKYVQEYQTLLSLSSQNVMLLYHNKGRGGRYISEKLMSIKYYYFLLNKRIIVWCMMWLFMRCQGQAFLINGH